MAKVKSSLGPLGSKFFSLMQVRQQTLVRLGDLQASLGLNSSQEHALLKRLTNKGYLLRLQKGAYLVPQKLPAGGAWRANDYYIINQYMMLLGAKYYIGGISAVYYHGLTQQIPNQFTVYNDKYSGKRNFGKLRVAFIKVQSKRIVGFATTTVPHHGNVNIATLAKTLLDLIQDWPRYHLLEEAFDWLRQNSQKKEFLNEFVSLAANYSNKSTMRRLGYFMEKSGVNEKDLLPFLNQLDTIKSYVPLYPNLSTAGRKNNKWQVIDNVK